MRNGDRDYEQWATEYILTFSTLDNCLFKKVISHRIHKFYDGYTSHGPT